ncbi:MAG: DUF4349 domain-containing protein, partial [Chloroflexi bacterium]|nr:DUF4349 domain-containing protein [Chloroflexota bacterium]
APAAGAQAGALIVRTGRLGLQVEDLAGTLPKARDLVAGLGGYVAGSEESNDEDGQQATITYRVPVERWQDAINGLRGLADRVLSETTGSEEVTAQVVDLDARLTNLRASEASLRDIMTRAANTAEVLAVQDKLTDAREQIERLMAAKNDLTGRAALATLAAHWATPVAAVSEVRSGWDLGREVDRALAQTVAAGQGAASLLVWLVLTGIPVLGPILLLAGIGVILLRRRSAGRPPRPRQTGWGPPPDTAVSGPLWAAPPPSGPGAQEEAPSRDTTADRTVSGPRDEAPPATGQVSAGH